MMGEHLILKLSLLSCLLISQIKSETPKKLNALLFVNNSTRIDFGFNFIENSEKKLTKDDSFKIMTSTSTTTTTTTTTPSKRITLQRKGEEVEEDKTDEYYDEFELTTTLSPTFSLNKRISNTTSTSTTTLKTPSSTSTTTLKTPSSTSTTTLKTPLSTSTTTLKTPSSTSTTTLKTPSSTTTLHSPPTPPPPPPTFSCSPLEFVNDMKGVKHCKSNAENIHKINLRTLFINILLLNLSLLLII